MLLIKQSAVLVLCKHICVAILCFFRLSNRRKIRDLSYKFILTVVFSDKLSEKENQML